MVAVADVVVAVAVVLVSCWLCVCVGCICVVVVGAEKHPCVHSKRLRVYIQKVRVCTGTKPTCMKHVGLVPVHTRTFRMYTRRRFERVHGFFHVFSPCRNTHKHTHTKHTPRPQRHHDHTTQHGDRNRERKRDETRQEKRKRDRTRRQDKRREKMKEKREFDSTQEKLTRSRQSKD